MNSLFFNERTRLPNLKPSVFFFVGQEENGHSLQGENCLSQRSALKIILRSSALTNCLNLLIMVSIKLNYKFKFMYICRKYLRVSAYIWYTHHLAILDHWSIQDRQLITFTTIQDLYSILSCGVLFLMTTVGDEWSYASRQRHMDQSIHDRTTCRCDQIHKGLSYIKEPPIGCPCIRLGFFFRYLYKGLWMYWKSFI